MYENRTLVRDYNLSGSLRENETTAEIIKLG